MAKNKSNKFNGPRINHQIHAEYVNLIDVDNHMIGQTYIKKALALAEEAGLDLVEINSNSYPPIAKICDYNKFLYEQKKRSKHQKKNVQKLHTIQIHIDTEENDLNHKFKQLRKFITDGDLVKLVVILFGRELQFKSQAFTFVTKCLEKISDIAVYDNPPKLNGKNIEVLLRKKVEK